jgi:hypothetical protein
MLAVGDLLGSLTPLLMQFAQRAPMAATPMANPLGGALMQQLPQLLGLLSQFGMGGSPMMNPMMNPMGVGPQMNPMMNPMAWATDEPHDEPDGHGSADEPADEPTDESHDESHGCGFPDQSHDEPDDESVHGCSDELRDAAGVPPQFSQPGLQGLPGGVPLAPNVPTTIPNTGEVKYDAAGNVKMDKDRAVREISRNFDQLTQGKDNYITKDDLKAIADGGLQRHQKSANYTPELRAAAKYLLDNPEAFKELETSDAKAQASRARPTARSARVTPLPPCRRPASVSARRTRCRRWPSMATRCSIRATW